MANAASHYCTSHLAQMPFSICWRMEGVSAGLPKTKERESRGMKTMNAVSLSPFRPLLRCLRLALNTFGGSSIPSLWHPTPYPALLFFFLSHLYSYLLLTYLFIKLLAKAHPWNLSSKKVRSLFCILLYSQHPEQYLALFKHRRRRETEDDGLQQHGLSVCDSVCLCVWQCALVCDTNNECAKSTRRLKAEWLPEAEVCLKLSSVVTAEMNEMERKVIHSEESETGKPRCAIMYCFKGMGMLA